MRGRTRSVAHGRMASAKTHLHPSTFRMCSFCVNSVEQRSPQTSTSTLGCCTSYSTGRNLNPHHRYPGRRSRGLRRFLPISRRMLMDAKPSTPRTPKKRGRKRKTVKKEDDEYVENIEEAKKLMAKFSKKKSKDDDMAFLKVGASYSVEPKIRNSQAHTNAIRRAEEAQMNKIFQIEIRQDALQTLWMCALCHQRSAQDELGDLFGPYYVNIRPDEHCASFLLKKSLKLSKNETYCIDVWFHGDCILWAPGIQMKGNQLTGLEEKLHQFWEQNCWICKNSGASINVDNKYVHFSCAKKQGYKINRHLLSMEP